MPETNSYSFSGVTSGSFRIKKIKFDEEYLSQVLNSYANTDPSTVLWHDLKKEETMPTPPATPKKTTKPRQKQEKLISTVRRPSPFASLNKRTRRVYRHIHECIHSTRNCVVVDNIKYPIQVSNTGQRFIKVGWDTFTQQNPKQKTKLAVISRTTKVTRILRGAGRWGHICGEGESLEIVDPKLENEQQE